MAWYSASLRLNDLTSAQSENYVYHAGPTAAQYLHVLQISVFTANAQEVQQVGCFSVSLRHNDLTSKQSENFVYFTDHAAASCKLHTDVGVIHVHTV